MDPHFIVVGCPGSGVEAMERLLRGWPDVAVAPSLFWITDFYQTRTGLNSEGLMPPQLLRKWADLHRFDGFGLEQQTVKDLLAEGETVLFREFIGRLLEHVARLRGTRLVGSISLDYLEMLPTVHRLWPDARFIHLIRDGREVYSALLCDEKLASAAVPGFADLGDRPIRTALWWKQLVSCGREAGEQLGPDCYCEIRYEALLAAPERELATLERFLGLPPAPLTEGAARGLGCNAGAISGSCGLDQAGAGPQSGPSREDVAVFEAAASPLLEQLGYPPTGSPCGPDAHRRTARIRQLVEEDEARRADSTPQALALRRRANHWHNPFVFIVGCPRSGTTLLQRILDAHPDLAICSETFWLPYCFKKRVGVAPDGTVQRELVAELVRYYKFYRMGVGRDELEAILESDGPVSYARFVSRIFDLHGEHRGKALVGDKTPDYVRQVAILHALWPDARIAHLIRDGRDVCLSAINWKRKAGRLAEMYSTWKNDPVTTAAFWWDQNVRQGRDAGQALGSRLYCEVRYEALIASPDEECARLCAFLGIPFVDGMLRFHEGRTVNDPALDAKNAWQPITAGLRDWRSQMAAEEIDRFETAAGSLLTELGYPLSCSSRNEATLECVAKIGEQFAYDSCHIGERLP